MKQSFFRHTVRFSVILLAILLAASCSRAEIEEERVQMRVSVINSGPDTKTTPVDSIQLLLEDGRNRNLYAWAYQFHNDTLISSAKPNYMCCEKLVYQGINTSASHFTKYYGEYRSQYLHGTVTARDILRYWVLTGDTYNNIDTTAQSHQISGWKTLPTSTTAGYPRFSMTVPDALKQPDLMAASTTVAGGIRPTTVVELLFEHLLSGVQFFYDNRTVESCSVKSIAITNVLPDGEFTAYELNPHWTDTSGTPVTYSVTARSTPDHLGIKRDTSIVNQHIFHKDSTLLMIPQTLGEHSKLRIVYKYVSTTDVDSYGEDIIYETSLNGLDLPQGVILRFFLWIDDSVKFTIRTAGHDMYHNYLPDWVPGGDPVVDVPTGDDLRVIWYSIQR